MEIHHKPALGTFSSRTFKEIHHLCIVSVHEVHFYPFHAPLLHHVEGFGHLSVEIHPFCPQEYAYTALLRIAANGGHMHTVGLSEQVEWSGRAFVDKQIFNAVPCCIVYQIAVGIGVDSG